MEYLDFVRPELLVLVPVLYFFGIGLKRMSWFRDNYIPLLLGVLGVLLAGVYVFAISEIGDVQAGLQAIFTGVTQGVLCAGLSVYANQLFKQIADVVKKNQDQTKGW